MSKDTLEKQQLLKSALEYAQEVLSEDQFNDIDFETLRYKYPGDYGKITILDLHGDNYKTWVQSYFYEDETTDVYIFDGETVYTRGRRKPGC